MAEPFEYKPGLERVQGLCDILGSPEKSLKVIHVAGTNGKGSTACMIASILYKSGIRVGMYYSPALIDIRDHYMINGVLISEDDYRLYMDRVGHADDELFEASGLRASSFEKETALAFLYFAEKNCDVAVMECGMGGIDDATNIATDKLCCVITSISLDHMQYLGNTLPKIAQKKAGIITSGCPVVAFDSSPDTTDVIRKRCEETGSILHPVSLKDIKYYDRYPEGISVSYKEYADVDVALSGSFQAENAALALNAVSVLRDEQDYSCITDSAIRAGLLEVYWPFRFELICKDPLIYVDGAHNPDAARKLRETIINRLKDFAIILVMGVFYDKDHEEILKIMSDVSDTIITLTPPNKDRAYPAAKLAEDAKKYYKNVIVSDGMEDAYGAVIRACESSDMTAAVAFGSLSYLNLFKQCKESITY